MNKPNVFVIGAPKCGTTSVCHWLSQHPEVFFSPIKEPHFFYSPYGRTMARDDYTSLFDGVTPGHKIVGEGSVWYLFSRSAVPKILTYNPKAKFIVCIRNPLEMAISLHAQKLFTGHEKIEKFEKAWSIRNDRLEGKRVGIFGGLGIDTSHMAYNSACYLGSQLMDLFSIIPEHRVHVIVMDDVIIDPLKIWRSLCRFLNIELFEKVQFVRKNPATKRRSPFLQRALIGASRVKRMLGFPEPTGLLGPFARMNAQKAMYRQPPKEVFIEMRDEFSVEIELLSELLNRNLRHWLE